MSLRTLCCAVALLLSSLTASAADPDRFLVQYLQFSEKELSQLREGRAIVKPLPSQANNEVAVAGAIRIGVSIKQFLTLFRDMPSFKQSPEVLEVRLYGELPASLQARLEEQARSYPGQRNTPALASPNVFLTDHARPLAERLQGSAAAGLEEFTYYSREKILKKPVEMLTRVSLFEDEVNRRAFIATSQAYASDYFDGSLGLTALLESSDGTTLIYINRSRAHALGGALSSLRRSIASKVICGTMARKLEETRARLTTTSARK